MGVDVGALRVGFGVDVGALVGTGVPYVRHSEGELFLMHSSCVMVGFGVGLIVGAGDVPWLS